VSFEVVPGMTLEGIWAEEARRQCRKPWAVSECGPGFVDELVDGQRKYNPLSYGGDGQCIIAADYYCILVSCWRGFGWASVVVMDL